MLSDGQHHGKITKSQVSFIKDNPCLIVETLFSGKKTIAEFFHDSGNDDTIERRKTFFSAVGHPEWFNLENFDTQLLLGLEYDAIVDTYHNRNKGIDMMRIKTFLPPEIHSYIGMPSAAKLVSHAVQIADDPIPF